MCGQIQQLRPKMSQAESNRRDSKGNFERLCPVIRWRIDGKICHHAIGAHTPPNRSFCSYFSISVQCPQIFCSAPYALLCIIQESSGFCLFVWVSGRVPVRPLRGGRRIKDCSQTWSFGFQFRLGKHFSDERGLPFTAWRLCFLNVSEYLSRYGIQMDPSVTERR